MRYGLDTNVLIYAHLPVFGESEQVRGYLQRGLADDRCRFSLTALVLHKFVHVVTDARRFDPPVAMAEALVIARNYLNRTNIECLPSTKEASGWRWTCWTRAHSGAGASPTRCWRRPSSRTA